LASAESPKKIESLTTGPWAEYIDLHRDTVASTDVCCEVGCPDANVEPTTREALMSASVVVRMKRKGVETPNV
jgi:hypothetical protein